MSRKIKTLIIALVVLVLLGGGYYGSTIYNKKKAEKNSAAKTGAPKIGNLDDSKIVKMESGGLVLEKKGDAWELNSIDGKAPSSSIKLDQAAIQNLSGALATIYVERVVDETPGDLSVYGLDKPSSRTVATDSDGKTAVYLIGNMAPSQTSCYIMQEGDPKVYTISAYVAKDLQLSLDTVRNKTLIPDFDTKALKELHIVNGATRIDISVKPNPAPPYLDSSFSSLVMTSPYKLPRGVDDQALDKTVTPLKNLRIAGFIDDSPSSLKPYGLDKPMEIIIKTSAAAGDNSGDKTGNTASTVDNSLDLLIGNQVAGMYYAKLANAPGVFAVSGIDGIVNVKPFTLMDKFPLLVNIAKVDHLSVTGGDKPFNADFQGKEDDAVYTLNGKKAESKSFKVWYQAVIGLLSDAEYPGPAKNPEDAGKAGTITIEYQLNTPSGARTSITLIPYDRDFYALQQEGTMEFLIDRKQVNNIFTTADTVTYQP